MSDTHITNAFTINSLAGRSFPFSAEVKQEDNLQRLSIFPLSIHSINDIIERFMLTFCVVFDVDHYLTKNDNQRMTLAEVAEEQGLQFQSYDREIIYFQKREFSKLLTDFYQYNFENFDCSFEPKSELILENYVACKDHDWRGESFLLDKLKESEVYLNSHDDCYLTVETSKKDFIKQLIQRSIQIYVITILNQKRRRIEVEEFPDSMIDEFLSPNKAFTIFQENSFLEGQNLIIPFSNTKYRFTEQKSYSNDGNICFDYIEKEWSINK